MKICIRVLCTFLFIVILVLSCSKREMAWEDVKRINQYTIYTQFLKENPGTKYKEEIDQAIDSLKQKWYPEMQD